MCNTTETVENKTKLVNNFPNDWKGNWKDKNILLCNTEQNIK